MARYKPKNYEDRWAMIENGLKGIEEKEVNRFRRRQDRLKAWQGKEEE